MHADCNYHSECLGRGDRVGVNPVISNVLTYVGEPVFDHKEKSHVPSQTSSPMAPESLPVTCNYVAMMSSIFCTGRELHDAERLESAGKCLVVWNTNMLICEQWVKGKCFFHAAR